MILAIATVIGAIAGGVYLFDRCSQGISPRYQEFPIHISANTSFSFPIELMSNHRVHLHWWVERGGEVVVGIVTPKGDFFGFGERSAILEKDLRTPLKEGSVAFSARQYGWGKGLYEVQITAYAETAEIKVRYWID